MGQKKEKVKKKELSPGPPQYSQCSGCENKCVGSAGSPSWPTAYVIWAPVKLGKRVCRSGSNS